MKCEAEKAAERIRNDKTITQKEILAIEVFLRRCISTCTNLNKTLNIYLIRKKRDEDAINDPTSQEETKQAVKQPKKRWWWF
ncbi:MAG: hypothetical protein BBJ57_02420 [Desulfobacterales bacterium PC51MH44]|nr:MAG: hypothetical protein BBJ57_02420 [Desulfobacterales bacterium PC51MH44]